MARNQRFHARFFAPPVGPAIPKAAPVSSRLRRTVFDRYGWTCYACDRPVAFHRPATWHRRERVGHVDHVFPRARGGQTVIENLVLLCEHCNSSKAADA